MGMKIRKKWISGLVAAVMLLFSMPVSAEETTSISNFVMPSGDMAALTPSQPMALLSSAEAQTLNEQMAGYTPQEESLLVNNAATFYYYENLDPIAKQIYDVLYQVAMDPVSEGNIGLLMTDMDPQSDEFYYEFNVAYRAICFDHPELFWLYSGEEASMGFYSEAISQNGFYFVYIMMMEPFANFTAQMTAFNNAASAFLADIDTSISEYETVRQIHDKLLDLVNYNDPVVEEYFRTKPGQDLAHTAYGCLVSDSAGNPNYAVCDGYSLAFEYLLQQCGIESIFICGMAGPSDETAGGHAWNMVKVDGVWYETDSTWNDCGSWLDDLTPGTMEYTYVNEALSDTAYREKLDHYLFLVSTDRITYFFPGDEYTYVTKDQLYAFDLITESVHHRMEDDGTMATLDSALMALAPIAVQNYS